MDIQTAKQKLIVEELLLLEEDILVEIDAELVLLGLGFIPVIGEAFDTILIIKYLKENRYIEAFLMLIALIPTVGDAIVKPFLLAGKALKAFKGTANFAKALSKSPKLAAMYKKIEPLISSPAVKKLSAQISKKNPELASKIAKGEKFHINAIGKVKAGSVKKVFSKTPRKGLGVGTQQIFRNKMLTKYGAKHGGALPKTALSSWYNIVYKGRRARRGAFRKMFMSSNLLGLLGLPNIESFGEYIKTDEGAEKVIGMAEFQDLYDNTTTPEDEAYASQQSSTKSGEEDSSFLGSALSIPLMKKFASIAIAV